MRYLAILLWLVGGVSILWCFKDFVVRGKGTPAPNDPPKELVAQGLYRYVRNPMYLSLVALLTGHLVWFQSRWLLVYASFVFLACHIFVTLYEEPNLTRKFGEPYQDYLHAVPRWLLRMTK